jgi:hypothetical protein
VGPLRYLAIVGGLLALLSLPCWLALVASTDVLVGRLERKLRRRLRPRPRMPGRSWRERRCYARLDRAMTRATAAEPAEPADPPIERIAADIRRLRRQRLDIAHRSPIWYTAVQRAYDERLIIACRELRVEEHLAELTGVDLDIERVRVEGALQSAGMVVGSTDVEWRQGRP